MSVASLKLSHGSYEEYGEVSNRIHILSEEMNKSAAILLDLLVPKTKDWKIQEWQTGFAEAKGINQFNHPKKFRHP